MKRTRDDNAARRGIAYRAFDFFPCAFWNSVQYIDHNCARIEISAAKKKQQKNYRTKGKCEIAVEWRRAEKMLSYWFNTAKIVSVRTTKH